MSFRKNLCKCMVCSLAVLSLYNTGFGTTVYAKNIVTVEATNVNLRKEASTEGEVISKASIGETLIVTDINGDWANVTVPSIGAGFVNTEFIQVIEADGTIKENGVNIRKSPSKDSEVIGQANAGDVYSLKSINNDFYAITYENSIAYIHKDFVSGALIGKLPVDNSVIVSTNNANAYAVVKSEDGINLRTDANTDAEIIVKLANNEVLDVISESGQWYKVTFNGNTGYVSSEFVEIVHGNKPERQPSQSGKGAEIITYAKQFLGTPYVWAGTNLKSGVDCSGFVYAVMRDNGISLNRSSREQINNGTQISKDQLTSGDLVFFGNDGIKEISHVGIYMGGGQFIHASSSRKSYCVTISSLSESYYVNNYIAAARVIR